VNIGKVIIVNEISDGLLSRLESLGFVVVQVELSEFLKAGGAAKCLVLRLSELDVTHSLAEAPRFDC
jgi:N-dimethylarginine dimethylaminohydrolase